MFIEPYLKSHAAELFSDSISMDSGNGKVYFKPYFGISPRRYMVLFKMGRRKDIMMSRIITWAPARSKSRLWESKNFFEEEADAIDNLVRAMEQNWALN